MVTDLGWLASQAKTLHHTFESLFYILLTLFILIGVVLEYFKLPLGQIPAFPVFVGRALVAALMLNCYPEISNTLADVIDVLAKQLGDLNQFNVVLSKMGDKLHSLSWSLATLATSGKEVVTWILSFLGFFLLYIAVYAINAFLLFTWTLLYVFSPLMIAFFVFPGTSQVTTGLWKSLIEISLWKIVWSCLATLLWSTALSNINQPGRDINFITSVFFNLILAGSVLLTPMVVHALAGAGFASLAGGGAGLVAGAAMMAPLNFAKKARNMGGKGLGAASWTGSKVAAGGGYIKNKFFLKDGPPKMPALPKYLNDAPWPDPRHLTLLAN